MKSRIQSIDALRGLVMIIMALDHIRDFFHYDAFKHNPLDLLYSPYPLFLTRWITHFCAPAFIFITGISAYLYGLKHTKGQLSKFLFTRGLWLIFLEFTVIHTGWLFNFDYNHIILQVIWAIGISMVFLSLMVKFPNIVILFTGMAIVFLHNLVDLHFIAGKINFAEGTFANDLWILLHHKGGFSITQHINVFVMYPIFPYLGLICTGYAFGKLFSPETDSQKRKKALLLAGSLCIIVFIVLRYANIYGDPAPWSIQIPSRYDFASFINTTKYPVSLLFALMTLGPSILFLYFFENIQNGLTKILITIGKVPMFYYIIHLYLIHTIAVCTGTTNKLHLWAIFPIWMAVVGVLYFPCQWYGKYKSAHPEKRWLSYL